MDGFHLAQAELVRLGRRDRMGAPDTFDALGYIALLRRLRERTEDVVYAPAFRREIEEPIAGAIAVSCATPLVVTEGNYLLVPDEPWAGVRPLLDECWYADLDESTRLRWLIQRHVDHGKTPQAAAGMGSPQRPGQRGRRRGHTQPGRRRRPPPGALRASAQYSAVGTVMQALDSLALPSVSSMRQLR